MEKTKIALSQNTKYLTIIYDKTIFAKNIKWLIDTNIISVKTICALTKKDRTLVQRWKTGERVPTIKDVCLICSFLNISMDDIITKDIKFD